jgi:carboxyl-terminal processing protease
MKSRIFLLVSAMWLVLSPISFAAETATKSKEDTYRYLNLFGDVFERVRSSYVEEATDEALIESAITGMLTALDPHSSYMNAKNFRDMQVQTSGKFGGLGIQVTMENGIVKVISPIDETPAARVGIKPNDLISHLDGEQILGLTLNDAVEKMRGPVGTDIKLTIVRTGQDPFDVTLTRAVIKVSSVRSEMKDKTGYLRITSFSAQTLDGVEKALAKFHDVAGKDLQGVILDLRNNPGGLLDQAVGVSDAFLDKGEVVSTRSRRAEDTQRFNARPGDLAKGLPMVILINGGSASASEIVAGALQDHRRAIILGTKSFGKGSVQTIIPLKGHGAMRLTTARYYTPSGRSIQSVGIEPDINVPQARVEVIATRVRQSEADLRGALENDGEKDGKADGEKKKPESGAAPSAGAKSDKPATKDPAVKAAAPPQDYQLDRAIDLIHGVSMFARKATN